MTLRLVFDTNVILSAYIHKKFSRLVFDYCTNVHSVFVSQWLLNELQNVLLKKFKVTENTVATILETIKERTRLLNPEIPLPSICKDPTDNNVLQLCEFVRADYLITGDSDLLTLKNHGKCSIITPREFYNLAISRQNS